MNTNIVVSQNVPQLPVTLNTKNWKGFMKLSPIYAEWSPFFEPVDANLVNETPCDKCGGKCFYRGFVKERPAGKLLRYKAFSVCRVCGDMVEF